MDIKQNTSYLKEGLLSRYLLIEAIVHGFISPEQSRKLYSELMKIYCIKEDAQTEQLYNAASSELFKDICTKSAHSRLCRCIEFAALNGQEMELTSNDRIILARKGEALALKDEIFGEGRNLTEGVIAEGLLGRASMGNTEAIAVLAFLEYNGICLCPDKEKAITRIRLAASWHSLMANLMGIAYDPSNKEKYLAVLKAILRTEGQKRAFAEIADFSGSDALDVEAEPVAQIMEKAFGQNIISRAQYDRAFAKVAFSNIICLEDKEKLLLDKCKETIASLSGIPFEQKILPSIPFEGEQLSKLPLKRERETRRILQNLSLAVRKAAAMYAPLLITGADEYVTRMYKEALEGAFKDTKVIELDGSTLTYQDFAPSKENVFLRGLSETKLSRTVFFITGCEELDPQSLEELCKMCDYKYRKKFRLVHPAVSIDLSGVLPVFFAKGQSENSHTLARYCDTLVAESVSQSEKSAVVDALFADGFEDYGFGAIPLEEGCRDFICKYEADDVCKIVDFVLQSAVYDNASCITTGLVKNVCEERNITLSRKGFGYIGGNFNA